MGLSEGMSQCGDGDGRIGIRQDRPPWGPSESNRVEGGPTSSTSACSSVSAPRSGLLCSLPMASCNHNILSPRRVIIPMAGWLRSSSSSSRRTELSVCTPSGTLIPAGEDLASHRLHVIF
ncbi:hypothetical protein BHM03_00024006 [Ensete ventricosum]|nr:hypothetical protein BHM03_00024006 [Ensete ventricosum]